MVKKIKRMGQAEIVFMLFTFMVIGIFIGFLWWAHTRVGLLEQDVQKYGTEGIETALAYKILSAPCLTTGDGTLAGSTKFIFDRTKLDSFGGKTAGLDCVKFTSGGHTAEYYLKVEDGRSTWEIKSADKTFDKSPAGKDLKSWVFRIEVASGENVYPAKATVKFLLPEREYPKEIK